MYCNITVFCNVTQCLVDKYRCFVQASVSNSGVQGVASLIIEAAENSAPLAPFDQDYPEFQSIIIFRFEMYDTSTVFFLCYIIFVAADHCKLMSWRYVWPVSVTTLQEVSWAIDQEPHVLGTACAHTAHQTCWLSRSIDSSRNIQFLSCHHEASKRRDILHEWAKFLQPAFRDEGSKQCCHHLQSIICIHCEKWGTGRRTGR